MVKALITGAAGSIGSALLDRLRGQQAVGLDIVPAPDVLPIDIRNRQALRQTFDRIRPEIVFHAAALKHVPELESHPLAAVQTNVFGTVNVACAAREAGVSKVVLLSTDKAVRPVSVMGRSKRVAEQVFQALQSDTTEFVTVRFGNVLGSSGSVLPIFESQMENGGPVTVTHRDMTRYFLSPDESVQTLIAAGTHGAGGEIFVPEMGAPRSILSLAQELIADRPIPIRFCGIRPGEKLSEQLWDPQEEVFVRTLGSISIYRPYATNENVWHRVESLRRAFAVRNADAISALLAQDEPEGDKPEN